MNDEPNEHLKDGEVLEPDNGNESNSPMGDNYIALISQYTERPDLLVNALEEHDPGFIKRMNEKAAERSERMADAKFIFGRFQAYSGLVVSVLAALVVLSLLGYAVLKGSGGFWLIMGLAIFYAISQGGPSGFLELCRGIADFFRKDKSGPDN